MNYPKFKSLEAGQPFFTVGINDQSIVKLIIQSVKEHPSYPDLINVTYYVIKNIEVMDAEVLVAEALKDPNTKIPTQQLITRKDLSMVVTATIPPLLYATTREQIEQWMADTK